MNDKDIIKALECCANEDASCSECPIGRDYDCRLQIASYALETINRQKAEIERKGRIIESYALQYGTAADKEVFLRKVRAEAYKEFAERADKKITEVYNKHIFGCNDLDAEEKEAIMNFSSDVVTALESIEKMTDDKP